MERKYKITMHVPLGRRNGTLQFSEEDGSLHGILEALGTKDTFTGTIDKSGHLKFSGKMKSFIRSFPYQACGNINGSKIELDITGGRSSFRITGREITKDYADGGEI